MLGKLLKHEMKSYRFSMGITFLAGVVFTLFMKILCMLPYQEDVKEMAQIISFYGYYYMIIAIGIATQILIVIRFYKTTVGDRGYLTWTLPAKTSSVLWSKVIAGGIWYIIAGIVIIILLGFFFVGNYWSEELNEMSEFFVVVVREIGDYFEVQYLIPVIIGISGGIVWSLAGFMLIYMCIAIGQLFGKWRILASIGSYFLIIFVAQCIYVAIILVASVAGTMWFESVENMDPFLMITIVLIGVLVLGIGVFAGVFAITNSIFKKHLNLE